MKYLMRKLRAKFTGSEEFRPKDFNFKEFVSVVGFETRQKTINDNAGNEKRVEELYLIVVDDKGRLISVMAYNCKVIIDEKENDISKTTEMLRSATVLLKEISERLHEKEP